MRGKGGEFTTHPLKFTGGKLVINYATSAAGSIQIEALDAEGKRRLHAGTLWR